MLPPEAPADPADPPALPELPPCEPDCDPDFEPDCPPEELGTEGMLLPRPPPAEPPEGMDDPPEEPEEPELPPEGMLDELPPLEPEDPPEEPEEEPEEPPEDGEVGEGMLEDCWPPAQPPTRKAEIALTAVTCAAMTSSRLVGWRLCIARSPYQIIPNEQGLGAQLRPSHAAGWSAAGA